MAVMKPFEAIRPREDLAEKIAALPYDVYNRKEAKEAVKEDAYSFLRIDRPETQFPEDTDMYGEEVYQKAHDLIWEMVEKGEFIREKKPCYYIYELTRNGKVQDGLVACASIDDYENGIIKKHENTRAEKEEDRIRHISACNAQTGPIFLAYRKNEVLKKEIARAKGKKPLYAFVSEDGIGHRVFCIDEAAGIKTIQKEFSAMDQIYIADGHHRAASAVKVGLRKRLEHPDYTGREEFNYFLSVLFCEEQLTILDYNRVVKNLNGFTEEEFLQEVKERFDVSLCKGIQAPKKKGSFTMYLGERWYTCRIRQKDISSDPVESLDVSVLQKCLLAPVLSITDPRTDSRIDFVGGIRGLKELERRVKTDCKVAFAMYPTSIEELFTVADAGLLMPPKSTWFEPKLRSGLFLHEI